MESKPNESEETEIWHDAAEELDISSSSRADTTDRNLG